MNEFKKITIKSIYDLLNSSFPIANQEIWDQSGLRLFDLKSTPISKIILCLDCTKDIIDYAIENNYKLIISHHPIFTKNKYFEPSKFDIENIKILKAHKISLLSLHTCIDNHEDGLNTYILKKIGVNNIQKNNCKYGSCPTSIFIIFFSRKTSSRFAKMKSCDGIFRLLSAPCSWLHGTYAICTAVLLQDCVMRSFRCPLSWRQQGSLP